MCADEGEVERRNGYPCICDQLRRISASSSVHSSETGRTSERLDNHATRDGVGRRDADGGDACEPRVGAEVGEERGRDAAASVGEGDDELGYPADCVYRGAGVSVLGLGVRRKTGERRKGKGGGLTRAIRPARRARVPDELPIDEAHHECAVRYVGEAFGAQLRRGHLHAVSCQTSVHGEHQLGQIHTTDVAHRDVRGAGRVCPTRRSAS